MMIELDDPRNASFNSYEALIEIISCISPSQSASSNGNQRLCSLSSSRNGKRAGVRVARLAGTYKVVSIIERNNGYV